MIRYSTNWMGPVSIAWYQERGLTKMAVHSVDNKFTAELRQLNIGDTFLREEILEQYSGGRIDIRGLDHDDYYAGQSEYSLPTMHGLSWNLFSEWLDDFTSEELVPYEELIDRFETETGHTIKWAPEKL
jgi:hypothetical protein